MPTATALLNDTISRQIEDEILLGSASSAIVGSGTYVTGGCSGLVTSATGDSRFIITNGTTVCITSTATAGTSTVGRVYAPDLLFEPITSILLNDNRPIYIWNDGTSGWITTTTVAQFTSSALHGNLQAAKKIAKPNHRPVRSAIKKGLKLITGLGFADEIKCFMGGSGIEVSHPDSEFKFVLTKDRDILYYTKNPGYSTPYKLELYTKTNVFISKLCVYMENTPVLDQVLGMMMFVKSGDEDLILGKANYPGLTNNMQIRDELSDRYPHLADKLRPSKSLQLNGSGFTQGGYVNATSTLRGNADLVEQL
jgi:hypothetical protein